MLHSSRMPLWKTNPLFESRRRSRVELEFYLGAPCQAPGAQRVEPPAPAHRDQRQAPNVPEEGTSDWYAARADALKRQGYKSRNDRDGSYRKIGEFHAPRVAAGSGKASVP